jgi:hypothetical protein
MVRSCSGSTVWVLELAPLLRGGVHQHRVPQGDQSLVEVGGVRTGFLQDDQLLLGHLLFGETVRNHSVAGVDGVLRVRVDDSFLRPLLPMMEPEVVQPMFGRTKPGLRGRLRDDRASPVRAERL